MLTGAVIGCGAMGRNHLRVLAELDSVTVAAVADAEPARLDGLERRFGVRVFTSHAALLAAMRLDFAIVAVPTRLHHAAVSATLAAGVHTLVEKPIAASVAEAGDLAERAARTGALLAVGHVERYNPAVQELKRRLDLGELGRVFTARVQRLGPFPARVRDVGVVLDLATHDLDVLRYLVGAEVTRVYAETEQRIHTAHEDLLSGLLRFANGVVAGLEINWLTPTKVRTLALTGERGMFLVDYLMQDLSFHANDYAGTAWQAMEALAGVSEGSMTRFKIDKREPLRLELEQFTAAVRARLATSSTREDEPAPLVVTAHDGLEALRLATLIVESGRRAAVMHTGVEETR